MCSSDLSDIMTRFQAEVARLIAVPETRDWFAKQGFDAIGNTPREFATRFQADAAIYAKVVREAKIPPQD